MPPFDVGYNYNKEELINKNATTNISSVSIVLAVLNERDYIIPVLQNLKKLVAENTIPITEIIFVDDCSEDGTTQLIRTEIQKDYPFQIRLIYRDYKFGLVNAQLTGAKASLGEAILIMDCDLQHPINLIPNMVEGISDQCDLVIASRYVPGGKLSWSPFRGIISRTATWLTKAFLPACRTTKDPVSGFFIAKRDFFDKVPLVSNRTKLLPYLLVFGKPKFVELPYHFVDRLAGGSKIVNSNGKFILNYLKELLFYWKITLKR